MSSPFDFLLEYFLFRALPCLWTLGLYPPGGPVSLDPYDIGDALLSYEFSAWYPDVILGPSKDPVGFHQLDGIQFQGILGGSHIEMIPDPRGR